MYSRSPERKTGPSTRSSQHPRRSIEYLEGRSLLALVFQPWIDSGELHVWLDGANDVASFQYIDSQTARLTVNELTFDFARSDITWFSILAGEGNDQVTIGIEVLITVQIYGGKGNDLLVGGGGVDAILGFEGNDTLIGNSGNDVLDGMDLGSCIVGPNESQICGPGFSATEADSIVGGDGDDSIWADAGTDTIDGGAGTNQITLTNYSDCVSALTADDPSQPQESGPDNISFDFVNATTARLIVNGSSFDFPRDKVTCFEAETGAGDDHVEVAASVNVPATLLGGDGNDTLLGGTGNDSLDGGDGDDSILGNDGNDTLVGGNGNNYLDGGNGNDSILGGPGDDTLADGMGDDTLDGGGGNDVYEQSPGSDDVLRDSGGMDTVNFARAARAIRFDLGRNAGQRQVVDANRNTVALNGLFENLIGSRFADDLVGDAGPNRIDGGGGDDTLDGGGGDRTPFGGSTGSLDRRGGTGCDGDTLVGGAGHDWLDGGRGADVLEGNSGNDVLVGDPARDQLIGGGGNNRNSRVTKTNGACDGAVRAAFSLPTLNFDSATGTLVVTGDQTGPTDDQIALALSAQGFVTVTINDAAHSSAPDSASYDPRLDGATAATVLAIQLQGLDGDDILSVGDGFTTADGHITLLGGPGNDRLEGSPEAELLVGGSGDDALIGGAGDDTLAGNAGNDQIEGGPGIDTADFSGSARSVRVNLPLGTSHGQGDDALAAIENVIGSGLADLLIGDELANQLLGGDGNDTLRGGDGDDTLVGDAGNDRLSGDSGNDSLDGGAGSNKLRPGPDQSTVLASLRTTRSEATELPDKLHDVLDDSQLTPHVRRRSHAARG